MKFETDEQLNELLPILKLLLPRFLIFYYSIKNYLNAKTDEAPIIYTDGDWPNRVHSWTMIKISKYIGPIIVSISTNDEIVLESDQINHHLSLLLMSIMGHKLIFFRSYNEIYVKQFYQLVKQKFSLENHFVVDVNIAQSHVFFMNEALRNDAIFINEQISLPNDFTFCKLDFETDAKIVTATWRHATANEFYRTKEKIRCFPSVGIRYIGDNKEIIEQIEMIEINPNRLVSFEIVDPAGHLAHQYTSPNFRRRGFGAAVERRLCQQSIAADLWPYKSVNMLNKSVIDASMQSSLWKVLRNSVTDQPLVTYPCFFEIVDKC